MKLSTMRLIAHQAILLNSGCGVIQYVGVLSDRSPFPRLNAERDRGSVFFKACLEREEEYG